ncbi:MAG: carboxypeptidase-like regulatory domain-containing protein [Chitinophagaceae bacterium]
MKQITARSTLFGYGIVLCMLSAAEVSAQYVEPDYHPQPVYLVPKVPFDSLQTKAMLGKGNATIKGTTYAGLFLGIKHYGNKVKVALYPLTPYFKEYLSLEKKVNPAKSVQIGVPGYVFSYRLEAVTNSDGDFTFPNMKPGKYYLVTAIEFYEDITTDSLVGKHYSNREKSKKEEYVTTTNNYHFYKALSKIVEIKKDGELVKTKLSGTVEVKDTIPDN